MAESCFPCCVLRQKSSPEASVLASALKPAAAGTALPIVGASSERSLVSQASSHLPEGCDWRPPEGCDWRPDHLEAPKRFWSTDQSGFICKDDQFEQRREFFSDHTVVLPTSDFTSISKAVEHLNSDAASKPGDVAEAALSKGHCIVCSSRGKAIYCLFLKGHQEEVYTIFGITPKWSGSQVKWLCPQNEFAPFQEKAILLDPQKYSSVRTAIHALAFPLDVDLHDESCSEIQKEGFGVVFSSKNQGYFVMYQEGKMDAAYRALDLRTDTPKARSAEGSSIMSWCRDFYRRAVGSAPAPVVGFQAENLVGTFSYHLTERYDVSRQLGSGTQGTAYLVKKKATNMEYCAKESHNMSEKGIQEFREEFEKMRQIRHPHCVRVEELLECCHKKQLFIVLEYAAGGDLYSYMSGMERAGVQPSEQSLGGLIHQAMSGVAYLHSQGFVHNDLKPENLLVMEEFKKDETKPPRLVITDYGCATHEKDTRRMFGDPRYQSPESMRELLRYLRHEIKAPRKMSNVVDIWSMGVTVFEVLTGGTIPFIYQECASTKIDHIFMELSNAILDPEEVRIPELKPAISAEAEDLMKQLLAKDWSKRPTASEVLEHTWFKIEGHTLAKETTQHITFACTRDKVRQILRTAVASKLRYDHLQQCHAVFEEFDRDNSGTIALYEFRQAYEKMGKDINKADELFQWGDIDGNKSLEFSEFAALTLDWQTLDTTEVNERLGDLISQYDPNGNGQVEISRFREIFAGAIEDDEITAALTKMDLDGDGAISVRELKAFVQLAPPYVTGRAHSGTIEVVA